MARRRDAVTDDAVMAAVADALGREGPGVSLATIARRAGLSAPRLVQRHGGRDQLILAAFEWWSARYRAVLRQATSAARPFEAFLRYCQGEVRDLSARDMAAAAQWLAFEWASPTLRGFNRRYLPRLRQELAELLRAAVRSGELAAHDSARVAERLLVHLFGMAMYYPLTGDPRGYRRELRRMAEWLIAPRRPGGRR